MKQSSILKIGTAIATFALFAPINSFAQADSTNTVRLTGVPIVKLRNQERETPVTNNITNTTNQITQTIQPDTYVASGGGSGYNSAGASADCGGGGVVLSGGGSCTNGQGLVAIASSQPNGNGWYVSCGAGFQDGPVNATAYAVCSRR